MSNFISRLFKAAQASPESKRTAEKLADLKARLGKLRESDSKLKSRIKGAEEKSDLAFRLIASVSNGGGQPIMPPGSSHELDAAVITSKIDSLKVLCGKVAASTMAAKLAGTPFPEIEFQVFSQWGEDGIIQHLLHHLPTAKREFVEFGVESYTEANTKFLLINNNWRGLIMDGSEAHMASVRATDLYWRHDLTAKCAFITPDNINTLLSEAGFVGDIGIYSVDVDGVDYWIWKATTVVNPAIVITEYNSVFGPTARVTVPCDPAFQRSVAHHSNILYGASLAALEHLADEKGFDLVGVNSAGNNAFFVRRGIGSPFPARSAADIFVEAKFREARDPAGRLTFASAEERRKIISECEVVDITDGSVQKLRDVRA